MLILETYMRRSDGRTRLGANYLMGGGLPLKSDMLLIRMLRTRTLKGLSQGSTTYKRKSSSDLEIRKAKVAKTTQASRKKAFKKKKNLEGKSEI